MFSESSSASCYFRGGVRNRTFDWLSIESIEGGAWSETFDGGSTILRRNRRYSKVRWMLKDSSKMIDWGFFLEFLNQNISDIDLNSWNKTPHKSKMIDSKVIDWLIDWLIAYTFFSDFIRVTVWIDSESDSVFLPPVTKWRFYPWQRNWSQKSQNSRIRRISWNESAPRIKSMTLKT